MDDKHQNAGVAAAPETGKDAPAPAHGEKRAFVSAGEKVHRWGTYLSIDWLFNATVGVAFAYLTKYTDKGKKYWSDPVTEGFTTALKPFIKDAAKLEKSAGYGNMFMSIIAGGMFTIPPLMILEHKKVKKAITQSLDRHIYGKDRCENDPKFQKAYDEIDNAPKKDFSSGMWARGAALAPLLAVVLIPSTKELSNKVWFNHVEKLSDKVAGRMGFSPEKTFAKLPLAEAEKRWKFIHESVAMDLGLGLPYAGLHSIFYNLFASRKAKKQAEKQEAPIAPISESTVPDLLQTNPEPPVNRPAPRPAGFTQREMPPASFTDRADAAATQEHAAAR